MKAAMLSPGRAEGRVWGAPLHDLSQQQPVNGDESNERTREKKGKLQPFTPSDTTKSRHLTSNSWCPPHQMSI